MGIRGIRSRLSFANVVSLLALFVAVGGGSAFALSGTNTVFSDDIVAQNVKGSDIKTGAVSNGKIAANAVTGGKVADNSLSGADVANGSLSGFDVAGSSLSGAHVANASLSAVDLADDVWHFVDATADCAFGHFCNYVSGPGNAVTNTWFDRSSDPNDPYGRVYFYRDRVGIVHLRGLARCRKGGVGGANACDDIGEVSILKLPPGYWPPNRIVFPAVADYAFHRVDVTSDGRVRMFDGGDNASDFVSLDSISFRCAPSATYGCPPH